ncbi:serine hydrolase domain-containing protein [Herbiconiux daphne]|uniref:Beta-lactamase family protein n=1 Tax=Herbiconiux daphne TaxID=2970914 RepID=A0ABT2H343_9MICO|nr:serine hydrolase domain-containing protein [Herbiconiux daphne]MCS5734358.1 beta-lactamase family protein [Herbiconiux daphne]
MTAVEASREATIAAPADEVAATAHADAYAVSGTAHPRFAGVLEAIERNLRTGDDLGCSVAVYQHGEPVVDAWAGVTTAGAPLPGDAVHPLFSISKALVGFCVARLVDDGELSLDERVAHYWPEFAAAGKGSVTVAQLLAHQAGLPGFDEPMTLDRLADWHDCVALLASQTPRWAPGTAHGYHALTVGYLAGEVIRRITGTTVGTYFRRQFAEPLGLRAWIGLPEAEIAHVQRTAEPFATPGVGDAFGVALADRSSDTTAAFANPPVSATMFNDGSLFAREMPAANGVADARSLARLMSVAVDGPLRALTPETVSLVSSARTTGYDRVLVGQRSRFGALFFVTTPDEPMLGRRSFGHNGFGGGLAFVDPESGIAFAYLGNRPNLDPNPHSRVSRLIEAVRDSL